MQQRAVQGAPRRRAEDNAVGQYVNRSLRQRHQGDRRQNGRETLRETRQAIGEAGAKREADQKLAVESVAVGAARGEQHRQNAQQRRRRQNRRDLVRAEAARMQPQRKKRQLHADDGVNRRR